MKTFNLPDLGEGLPDAEVVRWLVDVGTDLEIDQPMVEMETAKAKHKYMIHDINNVII